MIRDRLTLLMIVMREKRKRWCCENLLNDRENGANDEHDAKIQNEWINNNIVSIS